MATDRTPLPTLSTDGWVTSTPQKVDYLLAHFYAAEMSQTLLFPKNVHSFVDLVQRYKADIINLGAQVQESLRSYFAAYFPSVTVRVQCRDQPEKPGFVAVHMFIEVRNAEGQSYNAARVADIQDSKIMQISALNNGR